MDNELPTDEERWELIRRCLHLLSKAPTKSWLNTTGHTKKSKEVRIGSMRIVKYYGVTPMIEVQTGSGSLFKRIVAFHAKETFSRQLSHFEWTNPDDVPSILVFLRKHMILDDLADV